MPRRLKTNPMRALSAASRKSAASVMVMPTPTAGPLTAAMTGLRDSNIKKDDRYPRYRWSRCVQQPGHRANDNELPRMRKAE